MPVALQAQQPFPVRREAIEWTDSVTTRAIMWSPIGQPGELPTLLFSPGFGQVPSAYSRQVSAWASRGFVVIAIPHPFIENSDHAELYDVSQLVARQLVRALDRIVREEGSRNSPIARVDRVRIGVVGHSIGGSAAAQACAMERRFLACMDLDGTIFGPVVHTGMSQPFFLMRKRVPPDRADDPPRWYENRDQGNLHEDSVFAHTGTMYWLTVDRLDHMSFTDAALDAPRLEEIKAGPGLRLRAARTQDMTTRYVVDFFGAYLRDERRPRALDHSPFPGTSLRVKH